MGMMIAEDIKVRDPGRWESLAEELFALYAPIDTALESYKGRATSADIDDPIRQFLNETPYLLNMASLVTMPVPRSELLGALDDIQKKFTQFQSQLPAVREAIQASDRLEAEAKPDLFHALDLIELQLTVLHVLAADERLAQGPAAKIGAPGTTPTRLTAKTLDRAPVAFDRAQWSAQQETIRALWDKLLPEITRIGHQPDTSRDESPSIGRLRDLVPNLLQAMGAFERHPICGGLPGLARHALQTDAIFAEVKTLVDAQVPPPQRRNMHHDLDTLKLAVRAVYTDVAALQSAAGRA